MVTTNARADRKARTRKKLLDAAASVFAAKGYRGAAVDDVALAAGVTKGAVYAHFRTKEAMYLALVRERGLESLGDAETLFASQPNPDRRGRAMRDRLIAQLKDRDWLLVGYEFIAHAARDAKLRREVREMVAAAGRLNAQLIQRNWDDRGVTPAISADDFFRLIDGLGKHFAQQTLLDSKADVGPTLERTYKFLVRAAAESATWPKESTA
jgi:AcrR family transcriptional regulator